MSLSINASGMQLMQSASKKSEQAALDIIDVSMSRSEANAGSPQSLPSSDDLATPLLSLYQAEVEAAVGVKLLQTQASLIGSLIDQKA